jgi:hypothetical protein
MLTKDEDYHYASPDLTREKTNRLHRLATGEPAPRRPRPAPSGPRHQAGHEAETGYHRFIEDRFGPNGPPVHDHPNQEPIKKKIRARSKTD